MILSGLDWLEMGSCECGNKLSGICLAAERLPAFQKGLGTVILVRGKVCDSPCDVQMHSMEPVKWMCESRSRGVQVRNKLLAKSMTGDFRSIVSLLSNEVLLE